MHPVLRHILLACALSSPAPAQDAQRLLGACNVEWSSPSRGSQESMPLPGMRGAGANVWFAQGQLHAYLAHNGAYDADEVLRKLGALRLRVDGVDLSAPKSFSQELRLATGTLVIKLTAQDGLTLEHRLWFSSETLMVETKASRPVALEVGYGSWRANPAARGDDQVDLEEGALTYVHRNGPARRTRQLADEQRVDLAKLASPAADRVYGCAIVGRADLAWRRPVEHRNASWQGHEWTASSAPAKEHLLAVTLGAGRKLDPAAWVGRSRTLVDPEVTPSIRKTADTRWEEFWARSYVFVQPKAGPTDPAFQVGRNYQLHRFMDACNQEGELPLRPNGGIYTVDAPPAPYPAGLDNSELGKPVPRDPDWRRGGQSFAGQSLRWVGWPHGPDGDGDLREPLLRFYRERLPVAQARAKALGAEGAVYTERMSLAGLTDGGATGEGLSRSPQLAAHFSSGLEAAWMAIQARRLHGRDIRADLPWILGQLRFIHTTHDKSAPRGEKAAAPRQPSKDPAGGPRFAIQSANALEVVSGATNPAELVSALHAIVGALSEMSEIGDKERAQLAEFQSRLPALPRATRGGATVLAVADRWTRAHSPREIPELHALWPYRIVGRSLPDVDTLVRETWEKADLALGDRQKVANRRAEFSGSATLAFAANLGLSEECARRAVAKLSDAASPARFPAFHGPGNEWLPDLTWSGSGRVGVQEMLIDCEPAPEGRILILPAWPKGWDVTFRLRAPGNTRVTCVVEGGKIERLIVDPPARREQVVAGQGWQLPASGR